MVVFQQQRPRFIRPQPEFPQLAGKGKWWIVPARAGNCAGNLSDVSSRAFNRWELARHGNSLTFRANRKWRISRILKSPMYPGDRPFFVRSLTGSSTTSATVLEIVLAVCSTWNLAVSVTDTPFKVRRAATHPRRGISRSKPVCHAVSGARS